MAQLSILDPVTGFPHKADFSGIHYCRVPTFHKRNEICWLTWIEGTIQVKKHGMFYNYEEGFEYEGSYIDEVDFTLAR
jgi:hypothetical protein